MKNPFESTEINDKISSFEKSTGHELIVAATRSSDPYPGAAWRGATLVGLLVSAFILHFWELEPRSLEVLLVGAVILFFVYVLRVFKLHEYFALTSEMERETLQVAQATYAQFHSDDIGHHASILIYISIIEHKIHLLVAPDLKLSQESLDAAVIKMQQAFKKNCFKEGIIDAIEELEKSLLESVGKNPNPIVLNVEDRVFWRD
jgi:uncharacterized membrane protein